MNSLVAAVAYRLDLADAFALYSALLAVQEDFDFLRRLLPAAGTGGGVLRGLMLRLSPVAFTDIGYCPEPPAVIVHVRRPSRRRFSARFLCDAGPSGMLSVTRTVKASVHGSTPLSAVAPGVTPAVGCRPVRDVLAGGTAAVPRWSRDLHGLAAPTGAGGTAARRTDCHPDVTGGVCAGVTAFTTRWLVLRQGRRTPRSTRWTRRREGPTPEFPRGRHVPR